MAGYQKKEPIDLTLLLRTESWIKRADLVSGYVDLYFAHLDSKKVQPRRLKRDSINKRLERKAFNGDLISSRDASQFVIDCWLRDQGNIDVLGSLGLIHSQKIVVSTPEVRGEIGQVWVTTGSPDDLEELNQLRLENITLRAENKRLRLIEESWLDHQEKNRRKSERISNATKGKKKHY